VGGRRAILAWASNTKNVYISKDLGDKTVFLKRAYSVNYCKQKELFQEILELGFSGVFPKITVVLFIFISLPASVASGESIFKVLKEVKNYYRSTMDKIV
jgi:hypothetical protein